MLAEYFAISIQDGVQAAEAAASDTDGAQTASSQAVVGGFLSGVPILLPGYTPPLAAVPLFLLRLACEVSWSSFHLK